LIDRVILHRTTISAMEERLPRALFLRLHRTALVRIDAIRTLETAHDGAYAVLLSNGDTVRVSDSHIKKVKQILAR